MCFVVTSWLFVIRLEFQTTRETPQLSGWAELSTWSVWTCRLMGWWLNCSSGRIFSPNPTGVLFVYIWIQLKPDAVNVDPGFNQTCVRDTDRRSVTYTAFSPKTQTRTSFQNLCLRSQQVLRRVQVVLSELFRELQTSGSPSSKTPPQLEVANKIRRLGELPLGSVPGRPPAPAAWPAGSFARCSQITGQYLDVSCCLASIKESCRCSHSRFRLLPLISCVNS